MLKNVKNKNVIIPITMHTNNDSDHSGGVLAWSGWVFVYSINDHNDSNFKKQVKKFKLAA